MSQLDAVSCWWRISGPNEGSSMAHLALWKISSDADPRKEPPYALLVHFDRYDGPYRQLMARNQSPSSAPSVSFSSHNISCSRTQFSITIAYGILPIRLRASPFRALRWRSATVILINDMHANQLLIYHRAKTRLFKRRWSFSVRSWLCSATLNNTTKTSRVINMTRRRWKCAEALS